MIAGIRRRDPTGSRRILLTGKVRPPQSLTHWLVLGVIAWAILAFANDMRTVLAGALSPDERWAKTLASLGLYTPLIAVALQRRWLPVVLVALTAAGEVLDVMRLGSAGDTDVRNALMLGTSIVAGAGAYRADRRVAATVLAIYVATKTWSISVTPRLTGQVLFAEMPVVAALVGIGWVVGSTVRRRQVAEVRMAELAEQAQLARDRERSLLARELHDVVAHELTIIAMQATLMRMTTDQHELAAARGVIEDTSRRALDELKRLLQVLRTSDDLPETAAAQQASVASVVDAVADQLRALGYGVTVACRVGTLPRSVELAADRVLREAATNVVKHAPEGASVSIEVVDDADALAITIANGIAGPRTTSAISSTRLGLPGLAERLSLLGGAFSAGAEGDRWVVRTRIPHRPSGRDGRP